MTETIQRLERQIEEKDFDIGIYKQLKQFGQIRIDTETRVPHYICHKCNNYSDSDSEEDQPMTTNYNNNYSNSEEEEDQPMTINDNNTNYQDNTTTDFYNNDIEINNEDTMSSVSKCSNFSVKSQQFIAKQTIEIQKKDNEMATMRKLMIAAGINPDAILNNGEITTANNDITLDQTATDNQNNDTTLDQTATDNQNNNTTLDQTATDNQNNNTTPNPTAIDLTHKNIILDQTPTTSINFTHNNTSLDQTLTTTLDTTNTNICKLCNKSTKHMASHLLRKHNVNITPKKTKRLIYAIKSEPQENFYATEQQTSEPTDYEFSAKRSRMDLNSRKNVTCPMCSSTFTSIQSQKRHVKSIHNGM